MSQRFTSKDQFSSELFLKNISVKQDDRIIDFGCGQGFFCFLLSEQYGNSIEIFGLDRNKELIEKHRNKKIQFALGDLKEGTSLLDNYFNIGIMINVFHGLYYRNDIESAFKEVSRVLKQNSQLIIVDFKEESEAEHPTRNIRNNPDKIEKLIKNFKFEYLDSISLNDNYFLGKFIKK